MKLLICNVGSTSLKYKLFDLDGGERVLARGGAERVGAEQGSFSWSCAVTGLSGRETGAFPTHGDAIRRMLRALEGRSVASLGEIRCVGFKVVQGGPVTGTQYLTEDVLAAMEAYNSVAPAHNPPYIAAVRQFREIMPATPLIGAFETAFHATLPPEAYLYALPLELCRARGIRRYGFHGASHQYVSEYVAGRMGRGDLKLVSCHLGGSASLCAVENGRSVDTSMGMSLQCGIMNNNRVGDMDPYIIFYLAEACGMRYAEIKDLLQTKSGLYGLSGGVSNDMRDVEAAAAAGNADAETAVRAYGYSVRKYIGAYAAAMGGLDAVAFAGGIGRNSARVRALALEGLEFLGVRLDAGKNDAARAGDDLSADGSAARVFVVDTDEELIVARKAAALLAAGA